MNENRNELTNCGKQRQSAEREQKRDCVNLTAFAILLYKMSDTERELNANYCFTGENKIR